MRQESIEQHATSDSQYDQDSLLDHIRQAEADVVRAVALAQERAAQHIQEAQAEAGSIIEQAAEAGRREGEKERDTMISAARAEAEEIRRNAHRQAEVLRRQIDDDRMKTIVQRIVTLVLGQNLEQDEERHEA